VAGLRHRNRRHHADRAGLVEVGVAARLTRRPSAGGERQRDQQQRAESREGSTAGSARADAAERARAMKR
jgi:hypothetical protein